MDHAVNIAIDGVFLLQRAHLSPMPANFFCSFSLAAGETASVTVYTEYTGHRTEH